jgi:hypothetical protein
VPYEKVAKFEFVQAYDLKYIVTDDPRGEINAKWMNNSFLVGHVSSRNLTLFG